jgi:GAF domain-containing protein
MTTHADDRAVDLEREVAELHRQLAERDAELAEALAQQTATAEVLQVINASPGDLAPVFDAMLERALRLCEAEVGTLWVFDGEQSRVVANRGAPPEYAEFLNQGPQPRPALAASVVHIPDIRDAEVYRDGNPRARAAADLGGVRTFLAVPLRKDEAVLGRFSIYRQEVRPFTDKQIALLQNFATQAVIAIENARLITETREALEQQTATAEVLQVINSSPGDLKPVFDSMLEKALRLCEAAHGALRTYDGECFHLTVAKGDPRYVEGAWRFPTIRPTGPQSLYRRFVEGQQILHLGDIVNSEEYKANPGIREMIDAGGTRSWLAVALRKDDRLLGVISVLRVEVRPFSDKQIALLQNFAAQAVIAMENARLITETREALEQQTATAEVLQVINSSPGDLAPVFDAILEKAHALCGTAFGFLQLYDNGKFRAVAMRGVPGSVAAVLRQPIEPTPGLPSARLLDGERIVQEVDMAALVADGRGGPRAAAITENGVRTALFVPLRTDTNFLGCIAAFRKEVRPFSNSEIALLENFASQAVIAMENARLITETREALEQQTATAEVLQVINSSPGDLAPVFGAILEKAHSLCGAAFGGLLLYDGEYTRAVATRGLPEALADLLSQPLSPEPDGPVARLIAGDRFYQIADQAELLARPSSPNPRARNTFELAGVRTVLFVPLRRDDALLGVITVYRQEARPFTDKQIALLENFAAQAVIAMENARLITETREALEQQTATAEVLQVINSSPGDLAPVFDTMLEKAMRLCGAAFGELHTYDGERIHTAALRGVPAAYAEIRAKTPPSGRPGTGAGQMLETKRPIHILDVKAGEGYQAGDAGSRALVDLGGARTAIAVPLLKDEVVLGAIMIYRQEVQAFSENEIALLQNFAAQAVIAIENARLITETREALEQQTATAEVLQVINSSPGDLAPVFDAILEKAHALCGIALGELELHENGKVRAVAVRGVSGPFADLLCQPFVPPPGSPPARLLAGEPTVQISDVSELARERPNDPRAQAGAQAGLRTALFVPLRKDDGLLGYITGYRREARPFSAKEIALLQNFAAQAVIAIENTRLITETREALEQQTATAEVLQVINSSPGDLVPVFDAMLEKALRLCEAASGTMLTYDGECFETVAVRGVPARLAEYLVDNPTPFGPGTGPARVLEGENVIHFLDSADELYRSGDPRRRALVDLGGARTVLTVSLRKDEAVLGVFTIYRQEVRPFSDKQIDFVSTFAAQAVIAMENARLLGELRARTDEVAAWNRELEDRVAEQLGELERVGRLKRFLAPQLAELIVARGDEGILETHRRDIVVVFCDLRGFTAFAETAEPEEVLDLLREYHGALGPIVSASEGTLDHFSGDGIMVFFNDPLPVADAAERAVRMAVAMREAAARLQAGWRRQGRVIGFGVGVAQGYATLGQIGFADRVDYTAIGTVCNLAARLCAEAKDGQILVSRRVAAAVEGLVQLDEIGDLALKGLMQAVAVYHVAGDIAAPAAQNKAANLP